MNTPRSVFDVFVYLTYTSIRNRLATQAKQLRNPRYSIALVFGGVYIWYFLFYQTGMRQGGGIPSPFGSLEVELIASVGLLILFMRWWLFGNDRSALAFTQAEIQFLFPAPVARRSLIQFKLLRGQLAIVFNAILWVLLFDRGESDLPSILRGISIWALFTIFMLHRLGSTLVRTATAQHGAAGARRNIVALIVIGSVAAAAVWSGVQGYPSLRDASGPGATIEAIGVLLQEPIPRVLLAPFRLLLAPSFASDAGEWARAIVPVVLLMAVHYVWVLRSDLAFEDAAVEASVQRARRIEALRARRSGGIRPVRAGSRTWIPLAATGHPAVAIVWKNILAMSRTPGSSVVITIVAVSFGAVAMIISAGREGGFGTMLGLFALALALFSVLIGSRFVRIDLRQDLVNLRLLRTYPVEGSALVAAEVAGSTLVLTAIQMGLLTFSHLMLLSTRIEILSVGTRTLLLAVAPLILIVINAVSVLIQNAAALLFPAWVRLGTGRSGGVEVLGQNILTTIASLLALALALVPAVLAGAAAAAAIAWIFPTAVIAAALVGTAMTLVGLVVEIGIALTMLGEVFERGEIVPGTSQ